MGSISKIGNVDRRVDSDLSRRVERRMQGSRCAIGVPYGSGEPLLGEQLPNVFRRLAAPKLKVDQRRASMYFLIGCNSMERSKR